MSDQQTITPERQQAAQQVGAVFNSLHEYLRTLEPTDPADNRKVLTKQLEFAHARVDEAAMWAIKSVLTFGAPGPQTTTQPAPATPTNDEAFEKAPTTPDEILPTDNATGTEPV
jgi:hypothetical protein